MTICEAGKTVHALEHHTALQQHGQVTTAGVDRCPSDSYCKRRSLDLASHVSDR